MKIYTIYKGKLAETEVRETAKQYIVTGEMTLAFGCVTRIPKDEAYRTPIGAILEEKRLALAQMEQAKRGVLEAGRRYDAAIDLEFAFQE